MIGQSFQFGSLKEIAMVSERLIDFKALLSAIEMDMLSNPIPRLQAVLLDHEGVPEFDFMNPDTDEHQSSYAGDLIRLGYLKKLDTIVLGFSGGMMNMAKSINMGSWFEFITRAPLLHTLHFPSNYIHWDDIKKLMLDRGPQLKSLRLESIDLDPLDDAFLDFVGDHCPNLEEIKFEAFGHARNISKEAMMRLVGKCPGISNISNETLAEDVVEFFHDRGIAGCEFDEFADLNGYYGGSDLFGIGRIINSI
jgi:hypothetical protein